MNHSEVYRWSCLQSIKACYSAHLSSNTRQIRQSQLRRAVFCPVYLIVCVTFYSLVSGVGCPLRLQLVIGHALLQNCGLPPFSIIGELLRNSKNYLHPRQKRKRYLTIKRKPLGSFGILHLSLLLIETCTR